MFVKITDNFYQLTDVFDQDTLAEINHYFTNTSKWITRPQGDFVRLEQGISILENKIHQQLLPFITEAESVLGKLYQNIPQLWLDFPGYVNSMHVDASTNLSANIQVYLNDDDERMGTHCFDGDWYSVPYRKNCGYLLLHPTQIEHGMRFPVQTERRSLYQSYRQTEQVSNVW